jgi:hypothetical protein
MLQSPLVFPYIPRAKRGFSILQMSIALRVFIGTDRIPADSRPCVRLGASIRDHDRVPVFICLSLRRIGWRWKARSRSTTASCSGNGWMRWILQTARLPLSINRSRRRPARCPGTIRCRLLCRRRASHAGNRHGERTVRGNNRLPSVPGRSSTPRCLQIPIHLAGLCADVDK